MLTDVYRDPLIRLYYLATLPSRRLVAARQAADGRAPVIALFYHRVADEHPNGWTIGVERFQAQIDWLRARFDVVPLAEAQRRIAAASNHRPTATITFDDGYADNCRFAIPWLLSEGVPFTYFVSTGHVVEGRPFEHDVKENRPLAPNTPAQIRELAEAGVELGAHTRWHADLGGIGDEGKLYDEIVGSKRDLEAITGGAVRYFAFPFGMKRNLSQAAFRIAFQAGFWGACSAYGGYNRPGDDPFHIQRIHADPSWSRFRNWMTSDRGRWRGVERYDTGDYRLCF